MHPFKAHIHSFIMVIIITDFHLAHPTSPLPPPVTHRCHQLVIISHTLPTHLRKLYLTTDDKRTITTRSLPSSLSSFPFRPPLSTHPFIRPFIPSRGRRIQHHTPLGFSAHHITHRRSGLLPTPRLSTTVYRRPQYNSFSSPLSLCLRLCLCPCLPLSPSLSGSPLRKMHIHIHIPSFQPFLVPYIITPT